MECDNNQSYSLVEYPYLTSLDIEYAHTDYIEQFLNFEAKCQYLGKTKIEVFCRKTKKIELVYFVGSLLIYRLMYK